MAPISSPLSFFWPRFLDNFHGLLNPDLSVKSNTYSCNCPIWREIGAAATESTPAGKSASTIPSTLTNFKFCSVCSNLETEISNRKEYSEAVSIPTKPPTSNDSCFNGKSHQNIPLYGEDVMGQRRSERIRKMMEKTKNS